jgi:hypothetical protein
MGTIARNIYVKSSTFIENNRYFILISINETTSVNKNKLIIGQLKRILKLLVLNIIYFFLKLYRYVLLHRFGSGWFSLG